MTLEKRWFLLNFEIDIRFHIGASKMLPFFNPENFPFLTDWYYSSIMSGDSPPSERRELFEVHHGGGHSSNSVMVGTSTGHTTATTTTQTDPSAQPLLPNAQHKEEGNKEKEDRDKDKDEDKDKEEGGGSQRVDANKPQGGGGSEGAVKKDGGGGGGGGDNKGSSGANGTSSVAIGVGTGSDLMDGQIKPSSASATSGKTVNEVIEEEDCAVKCLYYTMQCCECTIT